MKNYQEQPNARPAVKTLQTTRYDLENTVQLLLDITSVLISINERLLHLEEENNITTSAAEDQTLYDLNTLYARLKESRA